MTENKVSPVRKQYLEIKKEHPNEIVFFRLGDFYETFDHDAEIASRELDIVLTSRNVAKNQRVPMAGVPFHAADNYIARLLKKGFHVAICEQMGDQPDNGLFDRQVVRVLSPGTIINPNILNNSSNNYLAVIYPSNTEFGFAYIDLSTGEFNVTSFAREKSENKLLSEVSRIQPSEIIIPESYQFEGIKKIPVTKIADWHFEIGRCQQLLKLIFNVETLDGFGLENKPLQSISSGVAVDYINQHDASALALLSHIHSYSIEDFMVLDESTRRSLEITGTLSNSTAGTLLQVIDKTKTPMGKRLIKNWINQPLIHKDAINKGDRIMIVDDLLATGGTTSAVFQLIEKMGGVIVGASYIIELAFLNPRKKMGKYDIFSLVQYN